MSSLACEREQISRSSVVLISRASDLRSKGDTSIRRRFDDVRTETFKEEKGFDPQSKAAKELRVTQLPCSITLPIALCNFPNTTLKFCHSFNYSCRSYLLMHPWLCFSIASTFCRPTWTSSSRLRRFVDRCRCTTTHRRRSVGISPSASAE